MATIMKDMEWVEATRKKLGLTRDELRMRLLTEEGIRVSQRSLDGWCRLENDPRSRVLAGLIRVIERALDLTVIPLPLPDPQSQSRPVAA